MGGMLAPAAIPGIAGMLGIGAIPGMLLVSGCGSVVPRDDAATPTRTASIRA
jgi:hypothetical protein